MADGQLHRCTARDDVDAFVAPKAATNWISRSRGSRLTAELSDRRIYDQIRGEVRRVV